MEKKVRWGLLSTAEINDVIIGAIRDTKRSELRAVGSRNEEKARRYAAARDIPRWYGSYEALLEDPEIDVVYISVPNSLHRQWTVRAAEAGKHILCEKPLVTTLEDFTAVHTAAEKNHVVLFEAFMYLHHPQTIKALELVKSGALGQVQFVNSWFDYYLPRDEKNNIRLNKDLHGGSLWDVGVYPNSFCISMTGLRAPVQVHARRDDGSAGVDLSAYGQLLFEGGASAQFSVSMRHPFRAGAHVVGEEAYILIERPWKPGLDGKRTALQLVTRDGAVETFRFAGISPYRYEVEAMESCIVDGSSPRVPLSMSREFLKSMLAVRESASTGRIVKVG